MGSFNGTAGITSLSHSQSLQSSSSSSSSSGDHQVQVQQNKETKNHTPPHSNLIIQTDMDKAPPKPSRFSTTHQSLPLPLSDSDHGEVEVDVDVDPDPKWIKRILASRKYSQKYRYKQLQDILDFQKQLKSLQDNIDEVNPKIKQADQSILMSRVENTSIKRQISSYTDVLLSREAECEKLRRERDVLKQLYLASHPQQQHERLLPKPMENNNNTQVSHVEPFNFNDISYNIHITNINSSSAAHPQAHAPVQTHNNTNNK